MEKLVLGVLVVAITLAIVPTTRDEIYWLWISYQDGTRSYELYLKAWSLGRHAAEAMRLYHERSWNDVASANTIREFERYLQVHPEGSHIAEAKANIKSLRADTAVYSKTLERGAENALRQF